MLILFQRGEELVRIFNKLVREAAGHLCQLLQQFGHEGRHVRDLQGAEVFLLLIRRLLVVVLVNRLVKVVAFVAWRG